MNAQNVSRAMFERKAAAMVRHAEYILGMEGVGVEDLRKELSRVEWFLKEGERLEMWPTWNGVEKLLEPLDAWETGEVPFQ